MRVLKNSMIYTGVKVLKSGIGLFLLPLYTVYLTPADYGIVSVVTSLVQFISIVLMLSLPGAGVRFHYDHTDNPEALKTLWGTIYTFAILNGVVFTGLLVLGHNLVVDPFFGDVPFFPYLLIGLLTAFFQIGYTTYQSYLRASQQGERFAANDMSFFFVKVTLTIAFVAGFKLSALGVILAMMLADLALTAASHVPFSRVVRMGIDRPQLKRALAYSLPMMPHALAGWAMTLIDRMFLVNMRGTADVGIYTIGFQIAAVLQMIAIAVNQAYSPWFFEKCKEGALGKRKIRDLSEFFVIVFTLMGLGLVLFSKEVLEIFVTKNFEGGWVVTPFLVFAFVFRGLYFMVVGPVFMDRVRVLPAITIGAALINVALNYLLIPRWGIVGASGASLATMFASAAVTAVISARTADIPYRWWIMFSVALGGLVLCAVVLLHDILPWWQVLLVKMAVALAATAFFFLRYRKTALDYLRTLRK